MKIKFLHKGIDAINLPQLLTSQSVMDKIPAYFKDKEPPIISYQHTNTVANKREQVDLKYLSEWKDQIKELVVERFSNLKEKIRSPKQKILNDPDVEDTLRRLHDDFVLVPADKAANNVIVVCKKYHIEILIKELGINTTNIGPNSTYIPSTDSFDAIRKSHCKFIESVRLEMSEEDKNLPYLYWIPKIHQVSFKHRFIAGSSKCTTKDLSCLFTKVLTTVKDGLIRYNNTKTSRNGVNNMWIVKNSTSLLPSLDQLDVRTATSVLFHLVHINPTQSA